MHYRIDDEDCVKVADFGLSRDLYEKDYYSSKDLDRKGKMPIKWMALESLEDFIFTTKSDVVCFQLIYSTKNNIYSVTTIGFVLFAKVKV